MTQHNQAKHLQVKASCEINAAQEAVFNAWLDPTVLSQWMFGKNVRDENTIHLQVEPQEGGRFSFLVERQGQRINHIGTYLEIKRFHKLVFTWGIEGESDDDESIVYVDIERTNTGCRVDLLHEMDAKWEAYVSRTRDGWTFMLNKLKTLWEK